MAKERQVAPGACRAAGHLRLARLTVLLERPAPSAVLIAFMRQRPSSNHPEATILLISRLRSAQLVDALEVLRVLILRGRPGRTEIQLIRCGYRWLQP